MTICNLWHIKKSNGLFYYSLDYLKLFPENVQIIVRPSLLIEAKKMLPGRNIKAFGFANLIYKIISSAVSGQWIFTPTAHPYPFIKNQIIVIHDDYPFIGKYGSIKKIIFITSIYLSKCTVGHINYSTSLSVFSNCKIGGINKLYMPNLGPSNQDIEKIVNLRIIQGRDKDRNFLLKIGLLGSDSKKKRYELLFDEIEKRNTKTAFKFLIYGHETSYFFDLIQKYPELSIELVAGDKTKILDYLSDCDAIVSVAEHEGFGRPLALAIASKIPTYLLYSKVFDEFFGKSTKLFSNVESLVENLEGSINNKAACINEDVYIELQGIRSSFDFAINRVLKLICER